MFTKVRLQILLTTLLMTALLMACGAEPPPPSQPKVVSKKIAAQPAKTDTKSPAQAQALPDSETPKGDTKTTSIEEVETGTSDLVEASLEAISTYDAKGRFDPFEPLFKEKPEAPPVATNTKGQRKRRVPQTPLERVALSQLKLSAIIRAPSGNRALVEDATGKGYVVVKGTYIGLNSGRVVQISKDRIIIEEEIENVLGALSIQNAELKLQKPAGEL
jgi:type IV pilus assembly protein PilP